jgi:hypothetical protein
MCPSHSYFASNTYRGPRIKCLAAKGIWVGASKHLAGYPPDDENGAIADVLDLGLMRLRTYEIAGANPQLPYQLGRFDRSDVSSFRPIARQPMA